MFVFVVKKQKQEPRDKNNSNFQIIK